MSPSKRRAGEFPKAVRDRVALRAAYRCSNPVCGRQTVGPSAEADDAVANVGEAAHICAASSDGSRFDPRMTDDERRAITNAIWLCGSCHTLVDRDVVTYPAELLRGWKQVHERAMADTLAGRRADSDRRVIVAVAHVLGTSPTRLENFMSPSVPGASPGGVGMSPAEAIELVASAMYSEEKDAVIVVAEFGNSARQQVTLRDAQLTVTSFGRFSPDGMVGGLVVPGHQWLADDPLTVEAGSLVKLAWLFRVAGSGIGPRLQVAQPIGCSIEIRCFPASTVRQGMDLYSIRRLQAPSPVDPSPEQRTWDVLLAGVETGSRNFLWDMLQPNPCAKCGQPFERDSAKFAWGERRGIVAECPHCGQRVGMGWRRK